MNSGKTHPIVTNEDAHDSYRRQRSESALSVIIPVYNGEEFIGECLRSLVRQSYLNFECVIVDDGSTDKTVDIIEQIGDPRFKVVEGKHRGSSAARNAGFLESTSEYVIFLDGDDIFHEDLLLSLYQSISINKADIAICNYRKYDTIHETYSDKILKDAITSPYTFNCYDMPECILNIFSGVAWNKLYRKGFLEEKNITFLESLVIGADSLFVHTTLLSAGRICYIDDILIDYRVNNSRSDVGRAAGYLGDISQTVDELYSVLDKRLDKSLFMRSFDNWAIGKCLWIHSLRNGRIDPVLSDLVQKYKLDSKSKDYYYQASARDLIALFQE